MSIPRNAGGQGNFVKEPGEYVVRVKECRMGESKSHKPMLTVVFQTVDEKLINGYFVQNLNFHISALRKLKEACGLSPNTDASDKLVGKTCGILVEAQEPDVNGRTFMSICGYDKASEVSAREPGDERLSTEQDTSMPF